MMSKEEFHNYYKKIIEEDSGGELLSQYVRSRDKLKVKCKNSHIFYILPRNIGETLLCPDCGDKRAIQDAKRTAHYIKLATEDGYWEVLEGKYTNPKGKFKLRCKKNRHIIYMVPASIVQKHGCKKCSLGYPPDEGGRMDVIRKIIKDKNGGTVLSDAEDYNTEKDEIHWMCGNGHKNYSCIASIKHSIQGCRSCQGIEKITIEEMHAIAESMHGKCLSSVCLGKDARINFSCHNGHTFEGIASEIKNRNKWCSKCTVFVCEEICRKIFEIMFQASFPKCRPEWMISDKNHTLELDGYCEQLNISFEYDGIHHYHDVFHNDEEHVKRRNELDQIKNKLCEDRGIKLIRIPYTIKKKNIQEYIISECNKLNIIIPNPDIIDIKSLVIISESHLQKLRDFAKSKKGRLISETYLGGDISLTWECENLHVFEESPWYIKGRKNFCIKCKKEGLDENSRKKYQIIKDYIELKKGKLITEVYLGQDKNMIVQCQNGHVFEDTPARFKNRINFCLDCKNNI